MAPGKLLALALFTVGCGRTPPSSQFPNAQAALDRMRETYACSRGLSGEAKLDYFGEAGRVRGDLWYLVSLPNKVRLDVVSPFGATISSLTSDGQRFNLLDQDVVHEQVGVPLYSIELRGHRVAHTAPPRKDPDGIDPPLPPSGPQCDAPVPMRLRIEVPQAEHDLMLDNHEVKHNPPLDQGAFAQETPAGVRVRSSPCGARP